MAAGFLSKPGTKYGPCKSPCPHTDCRAARLMAESACRVCGKPIGYDHRFFRGGTDVTCYHETCAEAEIKAGEYADNYALSTDLADEAKSELREYLYNAHLAYLINKQ